MTQFIPDAIADLSDVALASPSSGQALIWNSLKWVNADLPAGLGFSGAYGDLTGIPSTFAPSAHSHPQSDVTGLVSALAGKQASITTSTTAQYFRGDLSLATFPTSNAAFTNGAGYLVSSDLTGYQTKAGVLALGGFSSITGAIAQSNVTNLVSDLALKAPLASPTFTGTVTIPTGAVLATPASVALTNATSIPAGQLTGSIADARLSANVPLLNVANTFTGANLMTLGGTLTVSGGTITGGATGLSLAAGGTNQGVLLATSGGVGSGDVEVRNGTTSQRFNVYKTYTSSSVYQRFRIGYTNQGLANFGFGMEGNVQSDMEIRNDTTSGQIVQYSAGASYVANNAANRWKFNTNTVLQWYFSNALAAGIGPTDANTLEINNGTMGTFRDLKLRDIFTNSASFLHRTSATITGGSTSNAPTLTTGPVNGNPTKWIPIDDNGVTRYLPAW